MTDSPEPREGDRIAKLLARAGIASRREVERMIEEGRVRIAGEVVTTPATVLTSLAGVTVDGAAVKAPEAARMFAFHKPSGLITAERDPTGRPTIYTALRNALPPGAPRVMPVGRLDLNTEGLLLVTNDGELKRALELPSSGVPRTYRARTFGEVSQSQLEELMEGIEIEGIRYGPINANMERSAGRNKWIELTLTEGKNREIRRVLEHLGLQVSRLLRLSYGPFLLGDLQRGSAVEIPPIEVEKFRRTLGFAAQDPGAVRRAGSRPAPAVAEVRRPVAEPDGRRRRARPEHAERTARPERSARPERTESAGKPYARAERPARTEARPERSAKPFAPAERVGRSGYRTERPAGADDRADRTGRADYSGRADHSGRAGPRPVRRGDGDDGTLLSRSEMGRSETGRGTSGGRNTGTLGKSARPAGGAGSSKPYGGTPGRGPSGGRGKPAGGKPGGRKRP